MKIENTIKTAAAVHANEISSARTAQKSAEPAAAPTGSSGSDSVQLSTQLQSINKNLASMEAFDAERVEKIRQAISEGHFTVNPEKVADRLLETVRELIQTRQG